MKSLFNIFTKLIEKLKIMFIKTRKSTKEELQKHFYIEIPFSKLNYDFHFKLPILAQLRDEKEALTLRTRIIEEMIDQGLVIGDIKLSSLKTQQEIKIKENFIEGSFKDTGFINVEINLDNTDYSKLPVIRTIEKSTYKVNILNSSNSFQENETLFVFTINKSILED